jgi:predicted PurR-regulated permease PerM
MYHLHIHAINFSREKKMPQPALNLPVRNAIEIAVYLLLIFGILSWCLQILMPFVSFLAWGTIIAVALHQPFLKLRAAVGERNKLAVAIFVALGLITILVPAWMFAGSLIDSAQQVRGGLESGQLEIPPASEAVKEWPVVGEKLYTQWSAAAANLEGFLEEHAEQIKSISGALLGKMASIGISVLQFIAAALIAGALLANEEKSRQAILRVARRLVGDQAEPTVKLASSTIRSVAVGVLGIAFIQAVLGGVGMMAVGVPAAGVWALFILVLAIAQLPPLLVLVPAIFYVFATNDSTVVAVVFTVWSIAVSFADAVLKPLLLGRGVEAPMLVILLGAIGGMLMSGIIGLFLGAVILALGYKMFEAWMQQGEPSSEEPAAEQPVAEA